MWSISKSWDRYEFNKFNKKTTVVKPFSWIEIEFLGKR